MTTRSRDRRGRGARGPAYGTDVPARRSPRERFDQLALDVLEDLEQRHPETLGPTLGALELAVEECPVLPHTWSAHRVPLTTVVASTATTPPRLVLFRRPLEHRAADPGDLEALVLTVVVEQLADYLGVRAEDLHPDYEPPD